MTEFTWQRMIELLRAKEDNHLRNAVWHTPPPHDPPRNNGTVYLKDMKQT